MIMTYDCDAVCSMCIKWLHKRPYISQTLAIIIPRAENYLILKVQAPSPSSIIKFISLKVSFDSFNINSCSWRILKTDRQTDIPDDRIKYSYSVEQLMNI